MEESEIRKLIPMPNGIIIFNNGESCDMAEGPCSCGAWHRLSDWPEPTQSQIQQSLLDDK